MGLAVLGTCVSVAWVISPVSSSAAEATGVKLPGGFHAVGEAPKPDSKSTHKRPPLMRKWENKLDAFYDPANPSYDQLQRPAESLAGLPTDVRGTVDWMHALRTGQIQPRAALSGESRMEILDMDIVMKNTREMPHVRFPHRSHTEWLACSNCHPALFETRAGAASITMNDIFRGRYCGVCHDRVAFITFFACDRCHSVPQSKTGLWSTPPESP